MKPWMGLNPLSIGSVFPTSGANAILHGEVLIPFLSGLFFQHRSKESLQQEHSLNPLSIGSVFPTLFVLHDLGPFVLIPFLSGLFFQHRYFFNRCKFVVLIPFLSGLFFQPIGGTATNMKLCLNPLSIGSVFPTIGKHEI